MANNKGKYELKLEGLVQSIKQVEELDNKIKSLKAELAEEQDEGVLYRMNHELELLQIQSRRASKEMNELIAKKDKGTRGTLKGIGAGLRDVAQTATGASGGLDLVTRATQALGIESELLNRMIERFGGASEDSFDKAGKGASRFGAITKRALVSTGVLAFVVVIGSLIAYFQKTTEGSEKMGRAMAYLSGLFTGIVRVLADVGKAISDAFSDDKVSLMEKVRKKAWEVFDALHRGAQGDFSGLIAQYLKLEEAITGVKNTLDESGDQSVIAEAAKKAFEKAELGAIAYQQQLENSIAKNQELAQSDLLSFAQRTQANRQALKDSQLLLDSKKQVLEAEYKSVKAANDAAQVGGKKTTEMLKQEATLQAAIAANIAERQRLSQAAAEAEYTAQKENADRIKDDAERDLNLALQKKDIELEQATSQAETLRIIDEKVELERKHKERMEQVYGVLANTSDKAAAMKEITDRHIAAENEHRLAVDATNKAYSEREITAIDGTTASKVEEQKTLAAKAGAEKRYEDQQGYLDKAEALELQAVTDWEAREVRRLQAVIDRNKSLGISDKATEAELTQVKQQAATKKLGIEEDYNAKSKAIKDAKQADDQQKINEEVAAHEKKWEKIMIGYEAFAVNVDAVFGAITTAQVEAIDAQLAEIDLRLEAYRENLSLIDQQATEAENRINSLENQLATAKGAERDAIIRQLEQERAKRKQLAAERKAEDKRIQSEEQRQIKLEKEKEKALAKQEVVIQALTIAQHGLNAAKAIETILDVTKDGFSWEALALLAASTAGIIASMSAIKSASKKGFQDGGYTSKALSDSTEVGVVHANEYVLPAWMVRQNPVLVGQLEDVRTRGQYASGGMVAASTAPAPSAVDIALLQEMQTFNQNMVAYANRPVVVDAQEVVTKSESVKAIVDYAIK